MNMISGLARLNKMSAHRLKSTAVFALIFTAALFSNGCSKSKQAAQTSVPPAVDTNQTPAVQPATSREETPVVVAANPDGGADLKQLNHAYIAWIIQNRRRPKSFDEFVALSGIQIPPPPAGKKYVIDHNGFINYANN